MLLQTGLLSMTRCRESWTKMDIVLLYIFRLFFFVLLGLPLIISAYIWISDLREKWSLALISFYNSSRNLEREQQGIIKIYIDEALYLLQNLKKIEGGNIAAKTNPYDIWIQNFYLYLYEKPFFHHFLLEALVASFSFLFFIRLFILMDMIPILKRYRFNLRPTLDFHIFPNLNLLGDCFKNNNNSKQSHSINTSVVQKDVKRRAKVPHSHIVLSFPIYLFAIYLFHFFIKKPAPLPLPYTTTTMTTITCTERMHDMRSVPLCPEVEEHEQSHQKSSSVNSNLAHFHSHNNNNKNTNISRIQTVSSYENFLLGLGGGYERLEAKYKSPLSLYNVLSHCEQKQEQEQGQEDNSCRFYKNNNTESDKARDKAHDEAEENQITFLRFLVELIGGIFLYDLLFFPIHFFLHSKKYVISIEATKGNGGLYMNEQANSMNINNNNEGNDKKNKILIQYIQRFLNWLKREHCQHHKQQRLQAEEVVNHSLLDGSLQVLVNILCQQYSPYFLFSRRKHILSKIGHNILITFLLTESHAGYDAPFSLHNILGEKFYGGALRHEIHHAIGNKFYQQFFTYIDDYLLQLQRSK